MNTPNPTLADGFFDIPAGHIACVVTDLEMLTPPQNQAVVLPEGIDLTPIEPTDLATFRTMFRAIGTDWFWFSRLLMSDAELHAVLTHPDLDTFFIRLHGEPIGMLELDFREPGVCELSFLGFAPGYTSKGYGRALMDKAIALAWSRDIQRLWLHTCNFDHPAALGFYIRSGYRPYARRIEVLADPRLTGHMVREAAPHVPIIAR